MIKNNYIFEYFLYQPLLSVVAILKFDITSCRFSFFFSNINNWMANPIKNSQLKGRILKTNVNSKVKIRNYKQKERNEKKEIIMIHSSLTQEGYHNNINTFSRTKKPKLCLKKGHFERKLSFFYRIFLLKNLFLFDLCWKSMLTIALK